MKNLEYFIGKVCTIFTHPINRDFKEENPQTYAQQPFHYFVGVVEKVDADGILVTQALSGLKSYFFKSGLISIAEEEVLHPENEQDQRVIEGIKQEVSQKIKEFGQKQGEFVDLTAMQKLLRK